ncbi:50S ribosomal protein L25 [Paenibacillus alvei]|uniref:Large ribosomal subunit protein bL25 n=1 Tax=Paenibacillus alvei TaxID=44250 RepID=A0A383RDA1_PAEAL|nr:50S ribosomal protein L25 [Paenibacillus alvei]SYX84289.1 50S ribosomal protein L25 [Paenibacillus alvei]
MNAQGKTYQLKAERRTDFTRSSLRELRQKGRIPGVVYGADIESTALHVDSRDFVKLAHVGRTEVFQLQVEGMKPFQALIKDVVKQDGAYAHVDFQQVSANHPIRIHVPIEYIGTPAGVKKGGILQTQETSLEIEGLPAHLPSVIKVDISHLGIGGKMLVEDVQIPEHIHLLSHKNELLVSIVTQRGIEEVEDEESEAAAQAPTSVEA